MKHDWYAAFAIGNRQDVDALVRGDGRYAEVSDIGARASLLSTALGVDGKWPDSQGRPDKPKAYAQTGDRGGAAGLKLLVHDSGLAKVGVRRLLQLLHDLGIDRCSDIGVLHPGSFSLRLPVTLATPWLSRDDVGLYIIDSPVRKDPVFAVPTISPASWKGMLRWSAMKVCLEPLRDRPDAFARERAVLTHLFGSEKGADDEQPKDLAEHLDELCPPASGQYRTLLRSGGGETAESEKKKSLPRWRGQLHSFPTFFDRIDMEVLNPHDRETGAGTVPVYMECVPAGAMGVFEALYVPWPHGGVTVAVAIREALEDLGRVTRALRVLCLEFGISAKRSSGYGLVRDGWLESSASLRFRSEDQVVHRTFRDFSSLVATFEAIQREVQRG